MSPVTEVNATDRAREVAGELGVDLAEVKGTGTSEGPNTVTVEDVRNAAPSESSGNAPEIDYDVHRCPPLVSGSAGEDVRELAALLAKVGIETTISAGENPFSVLDASVLAGVKRFRADNGIDVDPEQVPDGSTVTAENTVTAADWAALYGVVGG